MNGLLVFIGGGIGALIRYIMYLVLPKATYFPLGTIMANFFGCFIATIVFTYFLLKSDMNSAYKTFFITGFCGGLSTLSALSLELLYFIQTGEYLRAALYLFSTCLICIVSVLLGLLVVKKLFNLTI